MLIIKGVNVYPAAIKNIISSFAPRVTGEIRIILDEPPPRVTPLLKIKIEHGEHTHEDELPVLSNQIAQTLHDRLKIRPILQWVRPGTLEKSTNKTPIFEKTYQKK